jgi:hypothetical protein
MARRGSPGRSIRFIGAGSFGQRSASGEAQVFAAAGYGESSMCAPLPADALCGRRRASRVSERHDLGSGHCRAQRDTAAGRVRWEPPQAGRFRAVKLSVYGCQIAFVIGLFGARVCLSGRGWVRREVYSAW